jgi:hypothetical protein
VIAVVATTITRRILDIDLGDLVRTAAPAVTVSLACLVVGEATFVVLSFGGAGAADREHHGHGALSVAGVLGFPAAGCCD